MKILAKIEEMKQVREELKKLILDLKKKWARGQEITIEDLKKLEEKI